MSTTTLTVLLLLFLTLINASAATSPPILGLDTFLSQQSRLDRNASTDPFLSLPAALRRSLSHPLPADVTSSILSLSLPLSLHVRLVGSSFPSSSASLLSSFLSAALSSDHFHVIATSDSDSLHRLAVSHSLQLDVSHSPSSLASSLSQTLAAELAKTPPSLRSTLISVNHAAVDQIISQDFQKQQPIHGVYLYFLDLGQQFKPYAYSYGSGDSSPGHTKCLGSIWTGKDRYIWIDLGAGPVDYGPALSGDGVLPRGEFHPLAALHGRPKSKKALLADLASLVWSAYQVLLVPSLRIPVQYENSLIVQFIHVHGSESGKDSSSSGLDWKSIEKTFMDEANENGLLLSDQSLSFRTYKVSYSECSVCSFAIARSVNSYSSRFFFSNYTLIASEYLDSKRLHQILSDSAEEFRRVAGFPEEDFGRVLPVYVFDLDHNMLLLLDRYHQTVSFKDMVIAVRTRNTQTVSDYSCNGRHVFMQTRELERPLVGSILQSMWGVSPTHMLWSPRHNTTLVDYTWSVGQTPFGPFSEISSLSFVQKDAARRNVLLTSLNYTISSAIDVLDSITAHGGERKLLKRNRNVEFVQRWNLFKYKLDKAVSAMSHLDFDMALYYLKSSDHDLYAMHSHVYLATQELEASLVCFTDPPFPWSFVFVVAMLLLLGFYIRSRGIKLFRNKSKQF